VSWHDFLTHTVSIWLFLECTQLHLVVLEWFVRLHDEMQHDIPGSTSKECKVVNPSSLFYLKFVLSKNQSLWSNVYRCWNSQQQLSIKSFVTGNTVVSSAGWLYFQLHIEGHTGVFLWCVISWFYLLWNMNLRKLFFVTRDLMVLRDLWRTWIINQYSSKWPESSIESDSGMRFAFVILLSSNTASGVRTGH